MAWSSVARYRNVFLGAEVSARHFGTSSDMSGQFSTCLMDTLAPVPGTSAERCQDTLDPGHFGPKKFRHHPTGTEVSGQFGTNSEMSRGHFGTGTELSRPPTNIFCYILHTEERFTVILLIIIKKDH